MITDPYRLSALAARNMWAPAGVSALRADTLSRFPMPPEVAEAAGTLLNMPDARLRTLLAAYMSRTPPADGAVDGRLHDFASPYTEVTRTDACRLLRFKALSFCRASVFMAPSCINAAFILDISPERGLITALNRAGIDCYVAEPDLSNARHLYALSLSAYVRDHVTPVFDAALKTADIRAMHVLGHCMGAMALDDLYKLRANRIRNAALIAPPLRPADIFPALRTLLPTIANALTLPTMPATVPASTLRMFFSLILWPETLKRTSADHDEQRARVNAWLRSGDDMPTAMLKDVFDRFILNAPRRFNVSAHDTRYYIGGRDRIVPVQTALPSRVTKRDACVYMYPGGHASMLSDKKAVCMYKDIAAFYAGRS